MGPHGSILLLSFPLFSSSPFPFLSFLHLHLFLPHPRLPFIFCTVSFHLKRAETPIDYIRSDLLPWWLRRFNHATNIVVRSVNDALDFSLLFSFQSALFIPNMRSASFAECVTTPIRERFRSILRKKPLNGNQVWRSANAFVYRPLHVF